MANKTQLQNQNKIVKDRLFSQASETPVEGNEKDLSGSSSPKTQKGVKKANKSEKRVLSFRAEKDIVAQFRAYCFAKYGMTTDQVGELALKEYMENHPLEKFEKETYKKRLDEELTK